MERILIFDAQVFQTPAWHRGMGKYSLELISSISNLNEKEKYWDEIIVLLSSKVRTEISVIESLAERANEVKIVKLPLERNEYDNKPVAERNRRRINSYVATLRTAKSLVHIDQVVLSLMQSEVAPAFSSEDNVTNYLLFYDLIPLMFSKTYLTDHLNQQNYLSKVAELLRADRYLAISKTVANDLSLIMGIEKERIVSIDGGPIDHSGGMRRIDVPKPFILMPTGNDLRKNNKRGIKAFDIFNKTHGRDYSLVVTSTFKDFEVKALQRLARNVVFTGNIDGDQLEYLYANTSALLFPTEYEGLGLPILEALKKQKPVACSDISVFQEISHTAFEYFDPHEIQDMAQALERAVFKKKIPRTEYSRIIEKFTWERTAKIFLDTARTKSPLKAAKPRRRLTFVCPPLDASENGPQLQMIYSSLSRKASVSFCLPSIDQQGKYIDYMKYNAQQLTINDFKGLVDAQELNPIYFINNERESAWSLFLALSYSGLVVLGEDDISKAWQGAVDYGLINADRLALERNLCAKHGIKGMTLSLMAVQKVIMVHSDTERQNLEAVSRKLPQEMRPRLVIKPLPTPDVVYDELDLDRSFCDYHGPESRNGSRFSDFSDTLLKEAVQVGVV